MGLASVSQRASGQWGTLSVDRRGAAAGAARRC